jgi:hypothetical protein
VTLRSAHVAGVPEREPARLRPDGEPVRAGRDRDAREEPTSRSVGNETSLSKRPESHGSLPSAVRFPISGLPLPGIGHVAVTLPVAASRTLTLRGHARRITRRWCLRSPAQRRVVRSPLNGTWVASSARNGARLGERAGHDR